MRLAVAAQTADTYVIIRGLQARLLVARQQTDTRARLRDIVHLQFERGHWPPSCRSQADEALAEVQATVPVLESNLDAAMNALDVLLGTPPGTHRAELRQDGRAAGARAVVHGARRPICYAAAPT